jgi:gliding motility-associated-like protein
LCDGGTPDLCDTAAVFITVRIRNARPDAVNDTIAATEDTLLSGSVGNNDTDPDGPGALFGVNTQPSHGTLSLGVNGLYIYTPSANYNGPDSFSYVLCDGGIPNLCDTATVYINIAAVNDAPVANDDNNTTALNTAVTGDVKPNDSDVDGPAATYSIAVVPSHGSLVLTDSGTYLYTPATDYVGCDTARISLCDGGTPNLCDTSLLVICTISGNVAPGAQNDYGQAQINTAITLNILANDSDLNGNLGTTPTILSNPTHGNVVVNADGTVTYTPTADFAGLDTFSYIICDGGTPVLCDTAQVFIRVVRQAGIVGVPIVTQTDSAVATCLSYTAAVYDSAGTIATVSCGPRHGRAVITTIDSINHELCFTYTPDSGYYGVDTFCVTLCQGGSCSTATMPVTINSKTNICYWLKGISPNGDGQNDDFYVNCNDSYPNSTLKVFNRWGDQVWDSNGHYTNNFEGKNGRGEVLPDGTYYYIYYLNDGSKGQHAGFIQVSR